MKNEEKLKVDLYRDTPVRYLGYASELGESFRPQVPILFVKLGYAVSVSYVVADTLDKTRRAWEANQEPVLTAADTLLWQGIATLILPAVSINRYYLQ
ncbi:mitochondrial fission process protein 1-like [Ctenocephalides felis]|uniref:mitochondrial fission process protein 1-like n=1 Tax=Ctenocephalides felis TaxID=7515 RepID=UPI000E6E485B|nr:mitochondrial fission process protein 1-like [Ctenocephalides felis]